jgi:peptidoglycan hydrolase CwlO-like protein
MKKLLIGGAVVLVLAFVIMGPQVIYHAERAFDWARDGVEASVPVDYRLEQAEDMIRDLGPEIDECRKRVAEEEVELDYLEAEIAKLGDGLDSEENALRARNASLKSGRTVFAVAGRSYSKHDMQHRVRLAFERFKQKRSLLATKRRQQDVQTQAVSAARRKLDATVSKKQNLELMVEQLRAKLLETQAMRAQADRFQFDDGKLSEIEDILFKARKDLDVTQRLLAEHQPADLGIEDPEVPTDVSVEIDDYFGGSGVADRASALVPVAGEDN